MAFLTIDLYDLYQYIPFWSCLDLTSVTFDMTLAIGVIVTLRVTVALVVTLLIRVVYSVFGELVTLSSWNCYGVTFI